MCIELKLIHRVFLIQEVDGAIIAATADNAPPEGAAADPGANCTNNYVIKVTDIVYDYFFSIVFIVYVLPSDCNIFVIKNALAVS